MKTITATTAAPPEPPRMNVSIVGIAELYAAACAFEPDDPAALNGLSDLSRVSVMTTGGSVRRLVEALAMIRGAS